MKRQILAVAVVTAAILLPFTLADAQTKATSAALTPTRGASKTTAATAGKLPANTPEPPLEIAADDYFLQLRHTFEEATLAACNKPPSKPGEDEVHYPDGCIYWQLGSAFDTALDYLRRKNDQEKARDFAGVVLKNYDITAAPQNNGGIACWYDDYGWWVAGLQRAIDDSALPGLWSEAQLVRLSTIARDNWYSIETGNEVWNMCQWSQECLKDFGGSDQNGSLQPLFDGGVWNYFWAKEAHLQADVCNTPCDPTLALKDDPKNGLCGRQNTVTNGLHLVAATRRLKPPKPDTEPNPQSPYYLQATQREAGFLQDWFNVEQPELSLRKQLNGGGVVIRERVSVYHDLHQGPGFGPDLAWLGDQGLMLGGAVDFVAALPNDPKAKDMLKLAEDITDGVLHYFVAKVGSTDVFLPWSHSENPTGDYPAGLAPGNGQDAWDYNTGVGVYMRYLLHAYRTNADLRAHLQQNGYPGLVKTYAETLLNSLPRYLTCFTVDGKPGGACSEEAYQANALATIEAAIQMQ